MKGRKPKADAIRRGLSDAQAVQAGEAAGGIGVCVPDDIAADPVLSEIWSFVAPPVNSFTDQDIPNLRLLVFWHAVASQAMESLRTGTGEIESFAASGTVEGPNGETLQTFKRHPAVSVLKQASAEIRALSDMLGLSPLARSRIGLMQATTVKTATETAKMFQSIDAAYELPEAEVVAED